MVQSTPHVLEFIEVSTLLFFIGVAGMFLNRKNIIILLMSLELMLLAVNLSFVAIASFSYDATGMIFSVFVLTVAGAESAIGLALLVIYYRVRGSVDLETIHVLKG